ncbi:hypothetical protein SAMN05421753_10554 [Planctomicrobium piriforme]|uniref:Uncharacterized protein n=1 Tax=Planctomicrobium piriforme TaxID=1576369 RepID=A0A1I3F2K5_9PLAN|nr:hypothetical protein SAMN05421753_10554 [Planctomicrobium piriforme]
MCCSHRIMATHPANFDHAQSPELTGPDDCLFCYDF